MFRQVKKRHLAIDVSIAVVAVLLRSTLGYDSIVMMAVVLGMGAVVAVHRLSPALALAGAWLTVVVQLGWGLPPDLSNAAVLVMLYASAAYGSATVKWLGLVSAGVGSLVATAYILARGIVSSTDWTDFLQEILGNLPRYSAIILGGFSAGLALFVLSWSLGLLSRAMRTGRESRAALATAEADQVDAERDVAIEQERSRIARDMHDVVAHSLAVVIAQADGARYAMRADPDSADAALRTISSTAREALGDVRMLLSQLRYQQGESVKPTLLDLDRLMEQMTASGLEIERRDTGSPEPLGTGQQLAVYRIVQESLTNALRHGDTAQPVVVELAWTAGTLRVTISSALSSGPREAGKPGHGIDGMRERAILAGGSFVAGERDGRFVVSTTMAIVSTVPIQVVPIQGVPVHTVPSQVVRS